MSERFKSSDNEAKNLKHFEKYVALKRVNRIMAKRPWAVNKHHIEDLRLANLSLSEIVHALLTLAHNHAMIGISTRIQSLHDMKAKNLKNKNIVGVKIEENIHKDSSLKYWREFQDG